MKKTSIIICFCFYISPLISQTLFTYGNHEVSKQAFLKAYHKNNSVGNLNVASDYLKLYINYKLKLQEAIDERLDTLSSQKSDLQNFANQISASYLLDSAELARLAKEAIERSGSELHLTYIFIPKNDSSDHSILKFTSSLLSKQFESIKSQYHNAIYEDANFITVFSLPYELENIVYSLPLNQISKPFKNLDGTYYFEVIEKRAAVVDKIQTAQILISVDPSNVNDIAAKQKADSVYQLLKSGGDFSTIARQLSDDKSTASNGGMMEEFGISKYSKAYNDVVFHLQEVNEFSKPFRTIYGYHIVKFISKTPINKSLEETNLAKWKQRVMEDERVKAAKEKLIVKLNKMVKLRLKAEAEGLSIIDYYRKNLIDYNNSFKEAVTAYEEGNLVFDLMNENVWQKGGTDSLGLLNYYRNNKSKYSDQKKFDEIRGQVVNDFENYLETVLVDRIKMKYPVIINKEVLRTTE